MLCHALELAVESGRREEVWALMHMVGTEGINGRYDISAVLTVRVDSYRNTL